MEIPDEVKVKLSTMTKQEVLKTIEEATVLELDKNIKISQSKLKNEANIFLSTISSLDKDYSLYTQNQLKRIINNPLIASYANQLQSKKQRLYIQSLYMLAARFEDYLSVFRQEDKERSILYVFTNADGNSVETYELTLRELILNADQAGRQQEISKTKLKGDSRNNLEGKGLFDEDHVKEAQQAYEGTLQRQYRFFEVHPKNQRQNGLIMQKENNEQAMGNLINTGDLKEAYIAYLFSDHVNNSLCSISNKGQPIYYSHEFIGAFYRNYITKVTNLPAILEEDVLTTDKQYGVKGARASLPSLQQYIDAASLILKQTRALSKEQLEKELNIKFKRGDETKGARNLEMTVEEATNAGYFIDKQLKDIQKSIG